MKPATQARKKFCLDLAEQILVCQQKSPRFYSDPDHLARLIDAVLPMTRNESIEDAEEWKDKPRLEGPNLLTRLRRALDIEGDNISIKRLLEETVTRLEKYKEQSQNGQGNLPRVQAQ